MALQPGDKLGHYKVLSLLGQSGMGEVYGARDTTLKRDVAVKVLLATLVHDHDGRGAAKSGKRTQEEPNPDAGASRCYGRAAEAGRPPG